MGRDKIIIQGAREHNLKNINVEIPRDKLVVITGLSGSGKSSLAFDTIYAEGQRRYVESLSAYARQFLGQMEKPDVDYIEGLSPAISIDQKTTSKNPRSTVGTVTEIYDYFRLLFARIGQVYCYQCGRAVSRQTIPQMADRLLAFPEGTRLQILAPLVRGRKGEHQKVLAQIRQEGYVRVRVDGAVREVSEEFALDKKKKHTIEVVVDRLIMRSGVSARLADSLETALRLSGGLVGVAIEGQEEILFSEHFACVHCGINFAEITPRLFSFNNPYGACPECSGLGIKLSTEFPVRKILCPLCQGRRLKKESLAVQVHGKNIGELTAFSVGEALHFFADLPLTAREEIIARQILKEIRNRLGFLVNVGLDYITLDRAAGSLSGGEAQRIRLATQIGSSLMGVLYILDEPSIGLHQRDNQRLIETLQSLRDLGNTVLVVEHDEKMMAAADHILDIGPGAGIHGGEVVAQGTLAEIKKEGNSLTGDYLSGRKKIPLPPVRRPLNGHWLVVKGARAHNLKNIEVAIPLHVFTCITGVSGSGKSTLVNEIIYKTLAQKLNGARTKPGAHDALHGLEYLEKVVNIDQAPIGRTPRSNPATYTGVFDDIRWVFAQTVEARMRGYQPGRFSFNVRGGRCEACRGDGIIKIEMHFLPDVYVPCEVCQGQRYQRETLEVKYKGQSIAQVLAMTVDEATEFFAHQPRIYRRLKTMQDVGLGYLRLGQPATTLSGGEAQRVKLATELSRRSNGKTFYILDEPTTGLHLADIHKLLDVLERLVDSGNTVVVIEHNLEVIKVTDYCLDLGPEGGQRGGEVVAVGTPEEICAHPASYTGQYLKEVIRREKVD